MTTETLRCCCTAKFNKVHSSGLPAWHKESEEGELVSRVHTLVAGVVQVYHRLQVVEEEEKGRKVEQEVEREDQGEETARTDGHGDDMKDSNLSHGACVREDEDTTTLPKKMRTTLSGCGCRCTHRAVPRKHRCCH